MKTSKGRWYFPMLCICIAFALKNWLYTPLSSTIWRSVYVYVHGKCIQRGHLTVIDMSDASARSAQTIYQFGDVDSLAKSTIIVNDSRYFGHVLWNLDVGIGEAYVDSYWETDDIVTYLRVLLMNCNNKQFQFYFYYLQLLSVPQWLDIWQYYKSEHSPSADEANVHHHYDWGTSLFELFLDNETMTYTAGIFDSAETDLETAQRNKVDRLVRKLNLKPGANVLEIGCGFGYLAARLLNTTQSNSVTAITLSNDQLAYANHRWVQDNDNETVKASLHYLYRDYRYYLDAGEQFDAIVSVEMIEAIGHAQLETFFKTVSASLKVGGRFVIQYGTYSLWAFPDNYKGNGLHFPTFVVKHVFPDHFVPDEQAIHTAAMKHNLELMHSEKFGVHYAKTLEIWIVNLMENKQAVVERYGVQVYRTFLYYLSWSQVVYQMQILHEVQAVFRKTNFSFAQIDEQLYTLT